MCKAHEEGLLMLLLGGSESVLSLEGIAIPVFGCPQLQSQGQTGEKSGLKLWLCEAFYFFLYKHSLLENGK